MTPNTSATSYLPVAEFLKRCDQRTVGDWVSDTGSRIPAGSLPTDLNLLAATLTASGMFESAVIKSQRYQPSDIATLLLGDSITGISAGQAYVYEVLTRLTEGLLWQRRPSVAPYPPLFDWAMEQLEQLQDSRKILPFLETQDAGVPAHHVDTAADVETRGLVVTQARRYFGRRANELNG